MQPKNDQSLVVENPGNFMLAIELLQAALQEKIQTNSEQQSNKIFDDVSGHSMTNSLKLPVTGQNSTIAKPSSLPSMLPQPNSQNCNQGKLESGHQNIATFDKSLQITRPTTDGIATGQFKMNDTKM